LQLQLLLLLLGSMHLLGALHHLTLQQQLL
jgi:hypothetical protein